MILINIYGIIKPTVISKKLGVGINNPNQEWIEGLCDDEWKVVWNADGYEVKGQYIGPYPASGTHTYTVYVFALKYDPFAVGAIYFDGQGNDIEQIAKELNNSPYTDYNNVIGYGKVSACYTAR